MRWMLCLLLSLILALGSQSELVAQSEMAGAYDQVVCGANGAKQVTLDPAGHAVHRHPCTHCLAAALGAVQIALTHDWFTAPLTRGQRLWPDLAAQATLAFRAAPLARAPPNSLV